MEKFRTSTFDNRLGIERFGDAYERDQLFKEPLCDPSCIALAKMFLLDTPMKGDERAAHELAVVIQDCVENWIFSNVQGAS